MGLDHNCTTDNSTIAGATWKEWRYVERIFSRYNTHSMSLFDGLVSRDIRAKIVTKRIVEK